MARTPQVHTHYVAGFWDGQENNVRANTERGSFPGGGCGRHERSFESYLFQYSGANKIQSSIMVQQLLQKIPNKG